MTARKSIYIPGFKHVNPIPNACRLGNLLMSGIILGVDPATGEVAGTLEAQCTHLFAHVRTIVEAAGGGTDDIIKMNVWLKDRSQRQAVNDEWLKMFPDPLTRPARHALQLNVEGPSLVQCDFIAVFADTSPIPNHNAGQEH